MEVITLETPVEKTYTKTLVSFKVTEIAVLINQSAQINVVLNYTCNSDNLIEHTCFIITGEEYTNWGSDDKYITDLIKSKVLSRVNI
jgi:hypothetical protein